MIRPRKYTVSINRLRANHYNLKNSLWRKGYIDHPLCNCGNTTRKDIDHTTFDCPEYNAYREELLVELNEFGYDGPLNAINIIKKGNINWLDSLIKFYYGSNLEF